MDKTMVLMFVGAVLVMLFLFTIFFIHILRLLRKSRLQTKVALMQAQTPAQPEPVEKKKATKVKK